MASKKKLLQAAAGSAAGAGLDINEAFSTYLYDGTGSAQTITNGIDLSGEGGLVWMKSRTGTDEHTLMDTVRGIGKSLISHETYAEQDTNNNFITSFNSNGFSLGTLGQVNRSGQDFVSWTFRKAPKFFDVVTYTGNGVAGRTVSHNLGSVPGMIIVKSTSNAESWYVYHRGVDATAPEDYFLELEKTAARTNAAYAWNDTAPTSTEFTVGAVNDTNQNGATFVAYLFAHNDGDGEFGPDSDQDIIKCGSFTSDSSGIATVNLGFEPQWLMFKGTHSGSSWHMVDVMRGMTNGSNDAWLAANLSNAEASYAIATPTPTGFVTDGTTIVDPSSTFIYMAIRRGPLAEPESATDVFAVATRDGTEPSFDSSFPVDFALTRTVNTADNWWAASRLNQGNYLQTNRTNAEASASSLQFDYMDGWNSNTGANSNLYAWMWKRAPSYFDVVAYSGTGVARTINHNLGAVPEMMWVKSRTNTRNWAVYHKGSNANPESGFLRLDLSNAFTTGTTTWNNTQPTASVFSVGTRNETNNSSETFIAYLFATLAGVSKVGSYTGTGSDLTIDCGFSSGARFVIIKRTDGTGNWFVFDTERGITSSASPRLTLDTTDAESSSGNLINPDSSGFIARPNFGLVNTLNQEYIFYAIA